MRQFTACPRYLQGAGLLDQIGTLAGELGRSAIVVIDGDVQKLLGERIENSFSASKGCARQLTMAMDVTHEAIALLASAAVQFGADVIVGVGGGKALDTGKGVAMRLGIPFVSVPTIASNDAPASSVIAVYDEQHRLAEVVRMPRSPDLVVVDSKVIVNAPIRFLRAGIGDALAKTFEAQACLAGGGRTIRGTLPSSAGLAIAEACYQLLRRHGQIAIEHARVQRVSEDVEAALEATILLSALGFENGGLSIAHAMARGLGAVPEASRALHGEHVAYGLLVQLVLEQRPRDFIDDILGFYRMIGLPCNLGDLGFASTTSRALSLVAQSAMQGPNILHFPRRLSASDLEEAMRQVETISGP